MTLAIHEKEGGFTARWQSYCEAHRIAYKPVNCYRSDIVSQLEGCQALMWHFHQGDARDILFAKQLLFSLEAAGMRVFPDFRTMWHFDDKVGQKYLLEALGAPLVPSYVFYEKPRALEWIRTADLPLVFKLRGGAGSQNVRLVRSRREAESIVRRAFSRGFAAYQGWGSLKERVRRFREGKATAWEVAKGVARLVLPPPYSRVLGRHRGYVYFQQFVPGNDHDIRVIVIGDRAFAIKRLVRRNDFRASGSGCILYEKEHIHERMVGLAFDLAAKLRTQCVAFDFVEKAGTPLVLEISYGFTAEGYDPCPGYWDRSLRWNEGPFDPYGWMVENVLVMAPPGSRNPSLASLV